MPNKRRQESSTGFYHVIVKGINKERIYDQYRERSYFKRIISKHFKKYQVEIYAFCIMSNHAHVMIRAEIQELSMFMARILAEYASYYNYKHHRNGHVFQNRFTSECIESEAYFWNCIRYIHMNPVKANMVNSPLHYKYCSMREYYTETPILVHERAVSIYKNHFADKAAFEAFHQKRQYEVFADIPDEVKEQQLEIAILIFEKMSEQYNLELKQEILERQELRREYISQLQKILGISKKRTGELYCAIREMVEAN